MGSHRCGLVHDVVSHRLVREIDSWHTISRRRQQRRQQMDIWAGAGTFNMVSLGRAEFARCIRWLMSICRVPFLIEFGYNIWEGPKKANEAHSNYPSKSVLPSSFAMRSPGEDEERGRFTLLEWVPDRVPYCQYSLHFSPINTWSWSGAGALFLHSFLVLSLQWTLLLTNLPWAVTIHSDSAVSMLTSAKRWRSFQRQTLSPRYPSKAFLRLPHKGEYPGIWKRIWQDPT